MTSIIGYELHSIRIGHVLGKDQIKGYYDDHIGVRNKVLGTIADFSASTDLPVICGLINPHDRQDAVASLPGKQWVNAIHHTVSGTPTVGKGCFIDKHVIFGQNVVIGDHVVIGKYCVIGDNCVIESFVTVSPHVAIHENVKISQGCSIGSGSLIHHDLFLDKDIVVTARSIVESSIANDSLTAPCKLFGQADILQHPEFASSNDLVKSISEKVKTFHHHYHILYVLAKLLGENFKLYVELGTYYGASMITTASANPTAQFYGIDILQFPNQHNDIMSNITQYFENTDNFHIIGTHTSNKDTLLKIRNVVYASGGIDLLFIDASHQYKDVVNDYLVYSELVREGGFIVFDDYLDKVYSPEVKIAVDFIVNQYDTQYNVIGSIPNAAKAYSDGYPLRFNNTFILQKKSKPILFRTPELIPITFAIVMSTYQRSNGKTKELISKTLESLNAQEYTGWKLFLIGDNYENAHEFKQFSKLIDPSKITYLNYPFANERETIQDKSMLWRLGGARAVNLGLKAVRQEGFIYHCHLDDDEIWKPDHLQTLYQAYTSFPEASFVYTRCWYEGRDFPSEQVALGYNNLLPRSSKLVHSTASWRLDKIPLFYTEPINGQAYNYAADAMMWELIRVYCEQKGLKTVFVPKTTVVYTH
jgi:predicted O-methyltransferase YrrM/acetyltransferase-like isoleucine patch superfamily enzyme